MELLSIIKIVIVLLFCVCECITEDTSTYQSVSKICDICTCLSATNESPPRHHVLGCSSKDFKQILPKWPEQFGENLTDTEIVASFSGNSIGTLKQLPATVAILSFSCRNCSITTISSAAFIDTINIRRLDLSCNSISSDALTPDIFRGRFDDNRYDPINLEDLNLSFNKITTLDRLLFEHTPNLKRLNLAYNNLKELDISTVAAIESLSNLEVLDLSYTELKTLPDSQKSLSHLKEIHLEGNKLVDFPEWINIFRKSLQSLYIGDNPIQSIQKKDFSGLEKLNYLNISGMGSLKIIESDTFSSLKSLKVLLCNNNPNLVEFDFHGLKYLDHLREIYISNNNLRQFDENYIVNEFTKGKNSTKVEVKFKLRALILNGNPWLCNCQLVAVLRDIDFFEIPTLFQDNDARCTAPFNLAGTLLRNLSYQELCDPPSPKKPLKIPIHESHSFFKPKSIAVAIISITIVVLVGLIVGYLIVYIKTKLKSDHFAFVSPIRYTTVRNSTMSAE